MKVKVGDRFRATRYHSMYGKTVDAGTVWKLTGYREAHGERVALVEFHFAGVTEPEKDFVLVVQDGSDGMTRLWSVFEKLD